METAARIGAIIFGSLVLIKSAWLLLMVTKHPEIEEENSGPVSGWGTPWE